MTRLRIIVNEYYFYENELVKVVGAKGMDNVDTMRYLIQWGDSQGRACSAEVSRHELSAAPTIERLHHDYRMALDAICAQANRIEELEAKQTLFQDVMGASKTFVERFEGGRLTEEGTTTKFDEEAIEFKCAFQIAASYRRDEELMRKSPVLSPYLDISKKEAAEELIDCLVTLGGMAGFIGVSWDHIEQAAHQTLDKLDKRTTETHTWDEKSQTVMKRSKLESAS